MNMQLIRFLRKFHSNEEGLESLQVVMIVAIAAMILLAAAVVSQKGVEWMEAYAIPMMNNDLSDFTPPTGGLPVEDLVNP